MATYNGYPNWAQWNVSLWINNDEGLYNLARVHVRQARTRREAAQQLVDELAELGISKTPDGARYTVTAVLGAIRGM